MSKNFAIIVKAVTIFTVSFAAGWGVVAIIHQMMV